MFRDSRTVMAFGRIFVRASPGASRHRTAGFLAWEEVLLDEVEAGGEEKLWFWESPTPFVVVGYSQSVDREVNVAACVEQGIPIFRRSSGGGTVVQGPGCLNFGLALRIPESGPFATITGTNQEIMERHRRALGSLLSEPVAVRGHTDLVLPGMDGKDRKFSGNAQRRKRQALLFHGTFLCDFDLNWLSRLLRFPSVEPAYRGGRPHLDFVQNTGLAIAEIRVALSRIWMATKGFPELPQANQQRLLVSRYTLREWNFRR